MKKVYQVGTAAPVRTYKEALRLHAKLRLSRYIHIWYQPEGCCIKYSNHWGFKPLQRNGAWDGLRVRSNF